LEAANAASGMNAGCRQWAVRATLQSTLSAQSSRSCRQQRKSGSRPFCRYVAPLLAPNAWKNRRLSL